MSAKESCECNKCQGACEHSPGWFLPEEIEPAATHLSLSVEDFFSKYLGVNWWEGDEPTFVLAPAVKSMSAGNEYPGDPRGTCVFYQEGKCQIHAVKPFECREYWHGGNDEFQDRHREVKEAWRPHQARIVQLLGREPETQDFSIFDLFRW